MQCRRNEVARCMGRNSWYRLCKLSTLLLQHTSKHGVLAEEDGPCMRLVGSMEREEGRGVAAVEVVRGGGGGGGGGSLGPI